MMPMLNSPAPERGPSLPSEFQDAPLKLRLKLGVSTVAMVLTLGQAHAASPILPTGGRFLAGAGVIGTATNGSLSIVQSSGRGVIDWTTFSIGKGGAVSINNGAGATLNKVLGGQVSQIDGTLTATGSLYFVNPQGVVVGSGGRVLGGGGVVLTTRDIAGQSFMSGGDIVSSGTSLGDTVNRGQIVSRQGDVVLIGRSVVNDGSIDAHNGVVDLAAADTVLMAPVGGLDGVYVASDANATGDVTQEGRIRAAAAKLTAAGGNVYTLAGNRSGLVEARGTATIDGQVWLAAPNGTVNAAGAATAVDADGSGGKIVVSGANVVIAGSAVLSAQGSRGGEVLVGVTASQTNLATTTTIADGAQILAGGSGGGGSIETSGHEVSIGAVMVRPGAGGRWLTDPTDLTLGSAAVLAIETTLNSGADVTETTTASSVTDPSGQGVQSTGLGDIVLAAPITWTGSGALTIAAFNNADINAAVSGAGGFHVTAGNTVNVAAAVSASVVSLTAPAGNVTLASGGAVAGASGVTIVASANFVNNAGAGAVSSSGGRWLIASTTPAANTLGGLTPDFIQYSAPNAASPAQSSGNGLLYSATPVLTLGSLTGTTTKVYDGSLAATLTSSNVTVSGLLGGDGATVTGVYATPDVGSGIGVTTTAVTETNGGAAIYGYTIANLGAGGAIGTITPKTLTAAIVGDPTKVYDRTTTATLTASNYAFSGVVSGSLAVNEPSSVAYASANAGATVAVTANFAPTNFVASGGLNLNDYILPTVATGNGEINPAPLQVTGVFARSKVYDSTTTAALAGTPALFGILSGDTITLSTAGAAGAFVQANVGSNISVTATGYAVGGSSASNYLVVQPTNLFASIAPAPLTLSGLTAANKVYDGTTGDTISATGILGGVFAGDTVGYSAAGATATFAQSDVGTGVAVAVTGFMLTGSSAGNYTLQHLNDLTANITPATLTASITGNPTKVYDGTNAAAAPSSDYALSGFVAGQSGTITQVGILTYASPNAGSETVSATLAPPDLVAGGGTRLSNYTLPTVITGPGTITPAPITAQIVGAPTKTYDATTAASLGPANFQLLGFVTGQSGLVTQASGTYASANAGAENVTATIGGFITAATGTLLANYSFPSIASGSGLITPAPLTIGIGPPYNLNGAIIGNPTKIYDGATTLTGLTPANFSLSGFQGSDSAFVTKDTGTYGSANAGVEPVSVSLVGGDYSFTHGLATNYSLPTALYGTGTITPAPITVSIVNTPNKTYDNSTRSVLSGVNIGANSGSGDFLFTGFVGSDGVSLPAYVIGAYASANAGSGIGVSATVSNGLAATGSTLLSNYSIPTTATGPGTINQAPLYVTGVLATNKVYDTTNTDVLNIANVATFGLVSGDAVSLSTSGSAAAFSTANAGSAIAVTVGGFSISGGASANYVLIQPQGLTATIFQKPVSLGGVTANNKVYDNSTAATFNISAATTSGVYASDSSNVSLVSSAAAGTFATKNVGSGIDVDANGFALSGSASGNYSLAQPTGLSANITPAPLTATVVGNPTKTYDATSSVTLSAANYSLSGFVPGSGDGATLPQSASASFASPHVNITGGTVGQVAINSTLVSSDFLPTGSTDLSNYTLPSTGTGFGAIMPVTLVGSIIGNPTRAYNATAGVTGLTTANYSLTGFVGSQSATVSRTMGTYASANAGPEAVTVSVLTSSDYAAGTGTLLTNYVLPTTLTGPGAITQATLAITGVLATNKVYDGATADTLNSIGAMLVGVQGSDVLTLGASGAIGTFASPNAGTGIAVAASGFTVSGAPAANYVLSQPTGLSADIDVKAISLASVTKIYDGTVSATAASGATYALSGVVASDVGHVSVFPGGVTGSYATQNVGSGLVVSLAGVTLAGSEAGNYVIPASVTSDPIGIINARPLTAAIINDPTKAYDTTTAAPTLLAGNYSLTGFVTGESGTVSQPTGNYASPNAGLIDVVTASLTMGNYTAGSGTLLSNYVLPSSASGNGTITPLALSVSIVNTPSRTYNATTVANLTPSNYSLTGFIGGQSASVTQTIGVYAQSDVSSTDAVTAALASGNFSAAGGTRLANYVLPTSATGNGAITPAPITATLVGVSKTYDTTTSATLTSGEYSLLGFFGGQGATVSQPTGTYASANAGPETVSASLSSGDFTATGGAAFSNYTLPTIATGMGQINQAPLTISGALATNKIYTGTTADTLDSSAAMLVGVLGMDMVSLGTSGAAGVFASPNVGTGIAVAASGYTIGGTSAGNYFLAQPTGLAANIGALSISLASVTKVYDGTTSGTAASGASYALAGVLSVDLGHVSVVTGGVTGSYDTQNVGAGLLVNLGGIALTGSAASNYTIASTTSADDPIGIITPRPLSATVVNTPTKPYDATTTATLTTTNYSLSGFVGAESATVTQTSGTYASANASNSDLVSTSLAAGNFTAGGGTLLSNYILPTAASGNGTITRLTLSASIVNTPTKTYNGATTATLNSANYSLSGFIGGQGATVSLTIGAYASANAGATDLVTAGLTAGNFTGTGGALLSNYVLPTTVSGNGVINPRTITGSLTGITKPYDTTTAATLSASNYTLSGFVGSQGATINQTTGAYASPNASNSDLVTASLTGANYTGTGSTLLSNYILPTTLSGAETITPLALTASIVNTPTKTYNGTTASALTAANYSVSGFIGAQSASVSQSVGTYASANASTSDLVSASLSAGAFTAGGGTLLSNYVLPTAANGNGVINPATLSAAIINTPTKPYDTTTAATLASANYSLSGFVGSQSATVTQTSGLYASADASTSDPVSAALAAGAFTAGGGTLLSNYVLPTTATGNGVITPRGLTASIVNTPTKIYDATTGATLTTVNFSLSGFVAGQGGDVSVSQTAGDYASANASNTDLVTASLSAGQFNATTTSLSNYVLPTAASGAGVITPATLTVMIVGAPTKPYDTTATASLTSANYSLSGFIGSQSATVTQTAGLYASADVSTSDPVSASLAAAAFTAAGGTLLSNYVLPTTAAGSGAITPLTLGAAIVNTPTKIYDGTTVATLASSNYNLSGFVGGQGASVSQTTGAYASANAGAADVVSASLSAGAFTAANGTLLSNYVLPATATGNGVIDPAQLIASIVGAPTKTYDARTTATLAFTNYSLSGFIGGQGATVSQAAGSYASSHASTTNSVTAVLASGDFAANGGTSLANYVLPTAASGAGVINPATLAGTLSGVTKVYDATTTANLAPSNYTLTGFVSGQGATVLQTAGTYASANAGNADLVTASLSSANYTATGATVLGDYVLPTTLGGNGVITPLALTAAIVNTPTKTYDGTTVATLVSSNYSLAGFIGGQGASVSQTAGSYASANAGNNDAVSASLSVGAFTAANGTLLANYVLPTSASGPGVISPAQLTASIVGAPTKIYDATTTATLASANYNLSGFVGSDSATVSQTVGTYASANAGATDPVSVSLSAPNLTAVGATNFANYILPTAATGNGAITQATLTATIVNTPVKTYDGATTATLASNNYALSGFVGGQGGDVLVNQTAGTYASVNASISDTVTASIATANVSATATNLDNYVLPTSASGSGTITPALLTATIVGTPTKAYDATTSATLTAANYGLSGFVAGEGASVNQTGGIYASPNADATDQVTTSLAAGNFNADIGTSLSNYILPTSAAGNGAISPVILTATIVGTPTKTYDATSGATLTASNYALSGFIGGQSATVSQTSGTYASANAGTNDAVSAGLAASAFTGAEGTLLANYVLPISASGAGAITPAQLTAAIVNIPTKSYDATTTATLATTNYSLSGFVGVQGGDVTVTQTAGVYASAGAGTNDAVTAGLAASNYAATTTNLANYILPTSATGVGAINPAVLAASIVGTPTKIYDGTTGATLGAANYALSGFVGGQGGDVTVNQSTGTYASPNASATDTVSAGVGSGAISATTTNLANYVLPTTASGDGAIQPARLTVAIVGSPSKPYDATAVATLSSTNYQLSGFIAGEGATIGQTSGLYASPDASNTDPITAGLGAGSYAATGNTRLSDYVLPTSATGNGVITPLTLTAVIVGAPTKTYDGTTSAMLGPNNYQLGGFIGGQGASVIEPRGTYASPNAGADDLVTASLEAGAFTASNGTLLSNYILPTGAVGAGSISPAPLGVALVGTPTKAYDGATGATLSSANYTVTGLVAGESVTVQATSGTYASPNASASDAVTVVLNGGSYVAGAETLLSNYTLPSAITGVGAITPLAITATISGTPTKRYDANTAATLTPSNFTLSGFLQGQGAMVTATGGTYASGAVGPETVTSQILTGANYSPQSGTLFSNYVLPSGATGSGLIVNDFASVGLSGSIDVLLGQIGDTPGKAGRIARESSFAVSTARTFIPYPAPDGLSTIRGNGLGSLPIVTGASEAGCGADGCASYGDERIDIFSGPAVINSTAEIMLQGGKEKHWTIIPPPARPDAASLGAR